MKPLYRVDARPIWLSDHVVYAMVCTTAATIAVLVILAFRGQSIESLLFGLDTLFGQLGFGALISLPGFFVGNVIFKDSDVDRPCLAGVLAGAVLAVVVALDPKGELGGYLFAILIGTGAFSPLVSGLILIRWRRQTKRHGH